MKPAAPPPITAKSKGSKTYPAIFPNLIIARIYEEKLFQKPIKNI